MPEAAPHRHFPVVDGWKVEPTVQMGTLEALLTSRDYEDVLAERDFQLVADRDDGELLVVRLYDTLVAVLATATDGRLSEVAVPWSQTEEFWGGADPDELAQLLHELAALARTAQETGQHLYCWVCL